MPPRGYLEWARARRADGLIYIEPRSGLNEARISDTREKLGIYARTGLLTSSGDAPLPSLGKD